MHVPQKMQRRCKVKKKLSLNEGLFDVEDELSYESPEEGEDMGFASMLIDLISDEWEAIQGYNDAIAQAMSMGRDDMVEVFKDIVAEENVHVGQLEKLLEVISPNTSNIEYGKEEVENPQF